MGKFGPLGPAYWSYELECDYKNSELSFFPPQNFEIIVDEKDFEGAFESMKYSYGKDTVFWRRNE